MKYCSLPYWDYNGLLNSFNFCVEGCNWPKISRDIFFFFRRKSWNCLNVGRSRPTPLNYVFEIDNNIYITLHQVYGFGIDKQNKNLDSRDISDEKRSVGPVHISRSDPLEADGHVRWLYYDGLNHWTHAHRMSPRVFSPPAGELCLELYQLNKLVLLKTLGVPRLLWCYYYAQFNSNQLRSSSRSVLRWYVAM